MWGYFVQDEDGVWHSGVTEFDEHLTEVGEMAEDLNRGFVYVELADS